jgi:hypothetical protein
MKKLTQVNFMCLSVKKMEETNQYHVNDIKIWDEKEGIDIFLWISMTKIKIDWLKASASYITGESS